MDEFALVLNEGVAAELFNANEGWLWFI